MTQKQQAQITPPIAVIVPSIADGGALYHRSLINNQKFKICKKIH